MLVRLYPSLKLGLLKELKTACKYKTCADRSRSIETVKNVFAQCVIDKNANALVVARKAAYDLPVCSAGLEGFFPQAPSLRSSFITKSLFASWTCCVQIVYCLESLGSPLSFRFLPNKRGGFLTVALGYCLFLSFQYHIPYTFMTFPRKIRFPPAQSRSYSWYRFSSNSFISFEKPVERTAMTASTGDFKGAKQLYDGLR